MTITLGKSSLSLWLCMVWSALHYTSHTWLQLPFELTHFSCSGHRLWLYRAWHIRQCDAQPVSRAKKYLTTRLINSMSSNRVLRLRASLVLAESSSLLMILQAFCATMTRSASVSRGILAPGYERRDGNSPYTSAVGTTPSESSVLLIAFLAKANSNSCFILGC